MWHLYILQCADDSYYVGHTSDLKQRLHDHIKTSGAKHTRLRLPVQLVHSESFREQGEALKRERQVKGWSRAKKKALIAGDKEKLIQLSQSELSKRLRKRAP